MPDVSEILKQTGHRTWPIPQKPWLMTQTWRQLLFAHYPIEPDFIAPFIPKGLELDTCDGQAWVSVVPFKMGFRLRYSPFEVKFDELNVRTYVIHDKKPGVFFFSLDANDLFTVVGARLTFSLPYHLAKMELQKTPAHISFSSQRYGSPAGKHQFEAKYQPVSDVYHAEAQTLDHWLAERYCLYSVANNGTLYRGDIHHRPWPLQQAEANFGMNTLFQDDKQLLTGEPQLFHYSEHLDIIIWAPEKLEKSFKNPYRTK